MVKAFGASPSASTSALAELFCQIEKFFKRLDTYIKVAPMAEMKEVIVKIMAEVLSILGIATRMLERGKMSESITVGGQPLLAYPCSETVFISLVRNTEIEDALGRLDKLTQEEALTASSQALRLTQGVANEVQCIRTGMQGVGNSVKGVKDEMKCLDDRVKGLEGKRNPLLDVLDGTQIIFCYSSTQS